MSGAAATRAAIVGLQGPELLDDERALFRRLPPAGVILFARNCQDPDQVTALTRSVRALFPDRHCPVLIDQEGGRVARLRPPHWPALPAAGQIGALATGSPGFGSDAASLFGQAIGHQLDRLGVDIDCAPCLDVVRPETTRAIGDRSFAMDGEVVGRLGRQFIAGLASTGVLPVLKHLPGHGRAIADSHLQLPVVSCGLAELERSDFLPFRTCADAAGLAMTCHVLFAAIDPDRPATHSPTVIGRVIRGSIGFNGILLSDDLGMDALRGPPAERAVQAVAAGCDIALYGNGPLATMAAVLGAVPDLRPAVERRLQALLRDAGRCRGSGRGGDALARLDELLAVA